MVTVGSLSKSVWGGLRIGWLRADADCSSRGWRGSAGQSQLSGPVLEQLAACHLLDAAAEIVAVAAPSSGPSAGRARGGARASTCPTGRFREPAGGLVLWCGLPGLSSTALVGAAERARGPARCRGRGSGPAHAFDDRLRLPYTQPAEVLAAASPLLAEAAADLPRRRPAQVEQPPGGLGPGAGPGARAARSCRDARRGLTR